jgi:hypothetical protein
VALLLFPILGAVPSTVGADVRGFWKNILSSTVGPDVAGACDGVGVVGLRGVGPDEGVLVRPGIVVGTEEGLLESADDFKVGDREGTPLGIKEGASEGMKEGTPLGIKEGASEGMKEGTPLGINEGASEGM